MVSLNLYTPHEVLLRIALRAKEKRLFLNLSQKSLSDRSGVSFGVIKKFERSGKISLESLLKLAFVLEALLEFADLFNPKPLESYLSLDQLFKQKPRRRGRK
jgi:transcriptional regulator with XRE-family HTH domain